MTCAYLAYLDPYLQIMRQLDRTAVRRQLILDLLTHDILYTSVSHILASDISYSVIREAAKLLESDTAAIVPYSRQCASVNDLLNDRWRRYDHDREMFRRWGVPLTQHDYETQLFNSVPGESLRDLGAIRDEKIEFLDSHLHQRVRHSPAVGMREFKGLLLNSWTDVARVTDEPRARREIEILIRQVEELVDDRLNRSFVTTVAPLISTDPKMIRKLEGATSASYEAGYLVNLAQGAALPTLSTVGLSHWTEEGLPPGAWPMAIRGQAASDSMRGLLRSAGIDPDTLDALSFDDVMVIRNLPELAEFHSLLDKTADDILASCPTTQLIRSTNQAADAAKRIVSAIQEQRNVSAGKLRQYEFVWRTTAALAGAAGGIAGSLINPWFFALLSPGVVDVAGGLRMSRWALGRIPALRLATLPGSIGGALN